MPEQLRDLVAHGMAKDPGERPAGAGEFGVITPIPSKMGGP
jgi:hypothetical protein